jgi:hypothetical protein
MYSIRLQSGRLSHRLASVSSRSWSLQQFDLILDREDGNQQQIPSMMNETILDGRGSGELISPISASLYPPTGNNQ